MPSKTKLKNAAIAARSAALLSIPQELIDQFVTVPMSGEAVNARVDRVQEGVDRARDGCRARPPPRLRMRCSEALG